MLGRMHLDGKRIPQHMAVDTLVIPADWVQEEGQEKTQGGGGTEGGEEESSRRG